MTDSPKPGTPLPWKYVERRADLSPGHFIEGEKVMILPTSGEGITRKEDALYIVHTANAYPKLVKALEETLTALHQGKPTTATETIQAALYAAKKGA